MTRMPEEGPEGFDAPIVRVIQQLRGFRRRMNELAWIQMAQVILLALILWRVW